MADIVGVRFKSAGKVYYFEPAGAELKVYDYVVVQTARGMELGQVVTAPRPAEPNEVNTDLKPIVRKATEEDIKKAQEFAGKEKAALDECTKIIAKHNLPMRLISAEYNLDGSKLTFYFSAEERVDFRDLVRELSSYFRTRIELRQVGPRDEAKLVGGLGRCGRQLCCSAFLTEFDPVSIKMAKEQDLPLDPMKISGVCGRLACCLAYESQNYKEAKEKMPRKGTRVSTASGPGVITGLNVLKETVIVGLETGASIELPVSQIKIESEPPRQLPPRVENKEPSKNEPVNSNKPLNDKKEQEQSPQSASNTINKEV